MGNYFKDKFNNNSGGQFHCPNCRMGMPTDDIDVDVSTIDVQLDNPEDILIAHFKAMENADTEDEVLGIMAELLSEGIKYGAKITVLEDIQMNIEFLNGLEYGYDDGS